ncbi:GPI ethanolamine phosphate transferase 1-like protein [Carex littledalei]|uniref:GPI ethanolamine phosphate transferase 1 n=1 Tax=Carex littledalei TaxID=544730 RepID=A0A833VZ82_9POAL|nr:GPI ethanolamine phosphate transferase 1-like protein [Carex littledalei]
MSASRRRERWLVALGVALHAVYMLSIFDIYFKTPIVHGMDPVHPRLPAPANRLVLLVDDGFRFVDDHKHGTTPDEWGLHGIERLDVNQADIAPLMATLVGLPCPVNSVGSLPKQYLNLNKEEEVEAVLANSKQILNQFLRKSQLKQQSSLYFKPFKPLENYQFILQEIENSILARDFSTAIRQSETLKELALSGFHYFQTYDWHMLMTVITLGYLGWMVNLIIHVVKSYTSFPRNLIAKKPDATGSSETVYIGGCILAGLISFLLFLEKSPPLYHAYFLMTTFLWTRIMRDFQFLKALCGELSKMPFISHFKLLATSCLSIFVLEFLIGNFTPGAFSWPVWWAQYEAVFYGAFALVLTGWILIESAFSYSKEKNSSRFGTLVGNTDERYLELADLRVRVFDMTNRQINNSLWSLECFEVSPSRNKYF